MKKKEKISLLADYWINLEQQKATDIHQRIALPYVKLFQCQN